MIGARQLVYTLLLLILSATYCYADFMTDFWKPVFTNAPKFSDSKLYNIDNIGFEEYDGSIAAWGDFNADKHLDIFFLYSNKSTVHVFYWNIEGWRYDPSDIIITLDATMTVTNVVGGDFSYDGRLDIIVQGYQNGDIEQPFLYIYYATCSHDDCSSPTISQKSIITPPPADQLLVNDINGDLRLDMFSSYNGTRTYWINRDGSYSSQAQETNEQLLPLSRPHSNSFVDLNGDCLADMFVTSGSRDNNTLQGEIWINEKDNGYVLTKSFPLPQGTGQITFADFVCWPAKDCSEVNSLFLVYNTQKPVCPSALFGDKTKCRPQNQLCTVDNNFIFSNTTGFDGKTLVIPASMFGGYVFYSDLENNIPMIIHTGDYNIDGYPDLLISLYDPKVVPASPHIELWESVGCSDATCGPNVPGRTFNKVTDGTDALTQIPDAYAAVFVDYGENGIADILVLTRNITNGSESLRAIFNNFYNDAFFFKTLGLNGVCTTMCSGTKFPDPKPYGVNFPGGTFKFIYSDMGGTTHIQIGAQLSQSAYLSLQTPYNLFGLGRTSNYIDQLFYGVPLNQTVHYNNWVGTIPNSQVVAIPYKPSTPTSWILELFINPSGIFFWVLIAFFVSLIILSSISFFLYKREKKQDEKLKQEQAHLFSFNAL
eukprot:gene17959-21432_t